MTSRPQPWAWRGLHFVIALLLPLLVLSLTSCIKVSEEQADYGPEVDPSSIDVALSKAIANASLDGTAVGQSIEYSVNRRVENQDTVTNLGATRVDVIDRVDDADYATFTLRISRAERNADGLFDTRVTEEPLVLKKASLISTTQNAMQVAAVKSRALQALTAKATSSVHANERKATKLTYHGLKEFTETTDAPKRVKEREDCGGLNPCSVTIHYIQFTMVQWYDDDTHQKMSFDFGFSTDTPFLPFGEEGSFDQLNGLLVLDCRSTYVPVDGRNIYVRDCQNLEDLQK